MRLRVPRRASRPERYAELAARAAADVARDTGEVVPDVRRHRHRAVRPRPVRLGHPARAAVPRAASGRRAASRRTSSSRSTTSYGLLHAGAGGGAALASRSRPREPGIRPARPRARRHRRARTRSASRPATCWPSTTPGCSPRCPTFRPCSSGSSCSPGACRRSMVGYDTLPMSEPANYRFKPGSAAWVSEYFRHLATADAVVCISDYARDSILGRLRRDPALPITVAHPGGDHLAVRAPEPPDRARLRPAGHPGGAQAPGRDPAGRSSDAVVVRGASRPTCCSSAGASASDEGINSAVRAAGREGRPRAVGRGGLGRRGPRPRPRLERVPVDRHRGLRHPRARGDPARHARAVRRRSSRRATSWSAAALGACRPWGTKRLVGAFRAYADPAALAAPARRARP